MGIVAPGLLSTVCLRALMSVIKDACDLRLTTGAVALRRQPFRKSNLESLANGRLRKERGGAGHVQNCTPVAFRTEETNIITER